MEIDLGDVTERYAMEAEAGPEADKYIAKWLDEVQTLNKPYPVREPISGLTAYHKERTGECEITYWPRYSSHKRMAMSLFEKVGWIDLYKCPFNYIWSAGMPTLQRRVEAMTPKLAIVRCCLLAISYEIEFKDIDRLVETTNEIY